MILWYTKTYISLYLTLPLPLPIPTTTQHFYLFQGFEYQHTQQIYLKKHDVFGIMSDRTTKIFPHYNMPSSTELFVTPLFDFCCNVLWKKKTQEVREEKWFGEEKIGTDLGSQSYSYFLNLELLYWCSCEGDNFLLLLWLHISFPDFDRRVWHLCNVYVSRCLSIDPEDKKRRIREIEMREQFEPHTGQTMCHQPSPSSSAAATTLTNH